MGIPLKLFVASCVLGISISLIVTLLSYVSNTDVVRICPSTYGPIVIARFKNELPVVIKRQDTRDTIECIGRSLNLFEHTITFVQNTDRGSALGKELQKYRLTIVDDPHASGHSYILNSKAVYISKAHTLAIIALHTGPFSPTVTGLAKMPYERIWIVGSQETNRRERLIAKDHEVQINRISLKNTDVLIKFR